MGSAKEVAANEPEEHLSRALGAGDPATRLRHAQAGLRNSDDLDADMRFLLLRQAYLAHVALHQLHGAVETTEAMIETGVMLDVAYTDQSRALAAMGRTERAIEAQRASARNAPTARRSFQLWSLATLQHFAGEGDAALKTIARALRFAGPDRPLIKAHRAYIALDLGTIVSELETIRRELAASPSGQGYGQFLLGMIAHLLGDQPKATVHLQAFLRRNASIDETKRLTLREELRRARLALAEFSSQ